MPRPPRSPTHYSNSTIWWSCPLCSKLCRSKSGRLRHLRTKHKNVAFSLSDLEAFDASLMSPDLVNELPVNSLASGMLKLHKSRRKPQNLFLDDVVMNYDSTSASSESPSSNAVQESDNSSESDSVHRPDIGSVNYHPIMNGKWNSWVVSGFTNSSSARPCDKHGNFLDDDELPSSEPQDSADWTPFTSWLQFEIAEFLFRRTQMSAGKVDELLTLWEADSAASGGEPPFVDHNHLYGAIDGVPVGGVPWQKFAVSYTGPKPETDVLPWMEQSHEVYFRDPQQLFLNVLANPDFVNDFDHTPMQQFDLNGSRRYENFMSGDWAWQQAVSFLVCDNLFTNYHIPGRYLRVGFRRRRRYVCAYHHRQR